MTSLRRLAEKHGTDKAEHGYTQHYEQHLGALRDLPVRLLEIGTHEGASLKMWADWMPAARIVGVDIYPAAEVNTDRVSTITADFRDLPAAGWDVVVDDGSHQPQDMIDAWRQFWPQVTPGGWYAIEDIAQGAGSGVLDELGGAVWGQRPGDVAEIHVYPSVHPARLDVNQYWQIILVRKAA